MRLGTLKTALLLAALSLTACNDTSRNTQAPETSATGMRVMTPDHALDFFHLRHVGEVHTSPEGVQLYFSREEVIERLTEGTGELSAQHVKALEATRDAYFLPVGAYYVPASVYGELQNVTTPYNLTSEVLNIIDGREKTFMFDATFEEMQLKLAEYGLTVRDVRVRSQDGALDLADILELADMARPASGTAALLDLSGKTLRSVILERVAARERYLREYQKNNP